MTNQMLLTYESFIMKIEDKLKKYAKVGYNVILTGRHGVGKTAIIKEVFGEVFGEHMVKWRYFSASTLDPWVDFIGIPKNYTREDGMEVFKIIPPEHFVGDEDIEGLFFDEINRADEKTLNALMELIQFKSINGRKFPNLKCVWAAENPHDDKDATYSVMPLDPAQKDRFHIQLQFPNQLNREYFTKKYNKEIFEVASEWWEKYNLKISPRKLDDMLTGFVQGFDLSDFTTAADTRELTHVLNSISEYERMVSVAETVSPDDMSSYFTLDMLRKNEKIIKKDNKKKLLGAIYDNLDEELQAFISKEFRYSKKGSSNPTQMTETQIEFLDMNSSLTKKRFNPFGLSDIVKYIEDFSTQFATINEHADYTDLVKDAFPFIFDRDVSTNEIRAFVSALPQAETKSWFFKSMYMIAHSTTRNKSSLELTKILIKLSGNREFIKFIGLNKIFFNRWKKDFPQGTYGEYKNRLSDV